MKKTIRLLLPQWQGGANPRYAFGAELLNVIAPQGENSETVRIKVTEATGDEVDLGPNGETDEVFSEVDIVKQMQETQAVLDEKQADRLIILGGDCSIDYVPFDYLHGKYKDKLGLIWLDAHTDLIEVSDSNHAHETIVTDLLGRKTTALSQLLKLPFKENQIIYAGLPEEELRPSDHLVKELNLPIVSPEELMESSQAILDWIEANDFEYVAIHFDLDVLSPTDFRSILTAKPGIDLANFGAAVGRLNLEHVVRLMKDLTEKVDIVGFGIAEHLPWDAMNLRQALSEISIFND